MSNTDSVKRELARQKMELEYGDPEKPFAHANVIDRMIEIGEPAACLLPLVLEMYMSSKLNVAPSALYKLHLRLSAPQVIDAMKEKGDFDRLAIDEKCELLTLGAHELEPELLKHLWGTWRERDIWRRTIVEALAVGGSSEAIGMLRVIAKELARTVSIEATDMETTEDRANVDWEGFLSEMPIGADTRFLAVVSLAIKDIERRIDVSS